MSVVGFIILYLLGALFLGVMGMIFIEGIKPEGKCHTCSSHLNPDEGLYCLIINDNPSLLKSLFCRHKT